MSARTWSSLVILAGAALVVVALPGTALAKGPTEAQVEGPGLVEPIALNWDQSEPDLSGLIDATGFWQLAEPRTTNEPTGGLGSRYVISFSVYSDTGESTPLALHAYPYAEPEPAIYVPAGQSSFEMGDVPEGWRTATSALTRWFEAKAPEPVVVAAADGSSDSPDTVAPASASSPWLPLALGGAGVVAIAGLLLLLAHRRAVAPAS